VSPGRTATPVGAALAALWLGLAGPGCRREPEPLPWPSTTPARHLDEGARAQAAAWTERLGRLRAATGGGAARPIAKLLPRRPTAVSLWATWCPPCLGELRLLDRLARGGVSVLGVSLDTDAPERAAATVAELGLAFPCPVLDAADLAEAGRGFDALPVLLVVDAEGRVTELLGGRLEAPEILGALLRAGARPGPP
jgi:thiol-disulfide isomerase/thioredoxin